MELKKEGEEKTDNWREY